SDRREYPGVGELPDGLEAPAGGQRSAAHDESDDECGDRQRDRDDPADLGPVERRATEHDLGALAMNQRAVRIAAVALGKHHYRQGEALGGLALEQAGDVDVAEPMAGDPGLDAHLRRRLDALLDVPARRRALRVEALDGRADLPWLERAIDGDRARQVV